MSRNNPISIKDRLASWRAGSAGFFRWLEDVKPQVPSSGGGYETFIPGDLEREEIAKAIDSGAGTVIFCWPRRHGKTLVSALLIVWRFTTRQTQTIAIVANSEKQSVDTAYKLVRTIVEQTGYTKALIDSGAIKVGTDSIRYEAMGSLIQGYAASASALYGKKLSIAQVSELHAARDDSIYQVLASSTIDTDDGLTLVDSTVGSRSSPLYALFQLWERGDDPSLHISYINYKDLQDACDRAPRWLQPQKLRSRAAQMLPAEFAQQHLNQWTAGVNALFPPDVIDRCKDSYAFDVPAITQGRAYAVGAGLDRAYGFSLHGDATVTSCVLKVLDGEEEHFYVMASDAVPFSMATGIKSNLTRYKRDFGMSRAALEHYNTQDIASWAGEQEFESETVSPTADRQANAFSALYLLAKEGRLHIHPSFEKLLKEMVTFEYSLEATGTSKGTIAKFSHAKGCHDDHIYALAWGIFAMREVQLSPYEMKGIACNTTGPAVGLCVLNGGHHVPLCADACRSMHQAHILYQQYQSRAGCAPMAFEDFFPAKVVNVGIHSVRR